MRPLAQPAFIDEDDGLAPFSGFFLSSGHASRPTMLTPYFHFELHLGRFALIERAGAYVSPAIREVLTICSWAVQRLTAYGSKGDMGRQQAG